jgi:hypothetical protein
MSTAQIAWSETTASITQRLVRADLIAASHHAEMARLALARAFVRLNESGDPDRKPVALALRIGAAARPSHRGAAVAAARGGHGRASRENIENLAHNAAACGSAANGGTPPNWFDGRRSGGLGDRPPTGFIQLRPPRPSRCRR